MAKFEPEASLDFSALAEMAQTVADRLLPGSYFLAGASMGGLIILLQLRRYGAGRVLGYINVEGNLLAEDCISRRTSERDGFVDEYLLGSAERKHLDEARDGAT